MLHFQRLILISGCSTVTILTVALLSAGGPIFADASLGPNPYALGYGFDAPESAAWGGWRRSDANALYAEWDVFDDRSHGAADDRSASPDAGASGVSSAWLGWSAGTFATGSGNLYNFATPEAFSVELAGPLAATPLRVALQAETQGQLLDAESFTLNGAKPAQNVETYRDEAYPSPMGPTNLVHRLLVWDLPAAPASFVFEFSSKGPHVSLTQVAVDIGPASPLDPAPPPVPDANADRAALIKLPAETLDVGFAAQLHAQRPAWFPETWADRELIFTQKTDLDGARIVRTLKGEIQALYYDERSPDGFGNQVAVDIYRPAAGGDLKIAECRLKPTKKKTWSKIALADQSVLRLGVAVYRLDLSLTEQPGDARKNRLVKRAGHCEASLVEANPQSGVPALQEGDYGVFRRLRAERGLGIEPRQTPSGE
jgi:hypothetical protein